MRYLTGLYCCASSSTVCILQQVSRIRDQLPIVFACVWEQGQVEEILQWFRNEALPVCSKGETERCVERVYRIFCKTFAGNEGEFAVLFCVGQECFYAWRGDAEIHLFNFAFNRLHRKKLTFMAETMEIQRARLENGIGILLGTASFLVGVPEKLMRECLAVNYLESDGQIERHLVEAAGVAEGKERAALGAIMVVTKEGCGE